jgi:pSer/pThr/pTyr-binding forkhead associated (FHA) protein
VRAPTARPPSAKPASAPPGEVSAEIAAAAPAPDAAVVEAVAAAAAAAEPIVAPAPLVPAIEAGVDDQRVADEPPTTPEREIHFKLFVGRARWNAPEWFAPPGEDLVIGRSDADIVLEGERFCAAREAYIRWREGRLWVEDIDGGCGVFVRIRTPVELEIGDEFILGDQLVRILENPLPDVGPGPGPTYFYSAPTWLSSFRVVQIYEGDREGACVVAHGTTVLCGRSVADLVFSSDPLVDEQHCIIEEQAGTIVLTDLGSRTGVFVRVNGEHELHHGDEILIGRTRLMVDLPAIAS